MNFFGKQTDDNYEEDHKALPDVPPWSEMRLLTYEREVLGFYVTSNPLTHHAEIINIYSTHNCSQLADIGQEKTVIIGGMIMKVRFNLTKTGRNAGSKMAVFTLEDLQGQVEVVMFPNVLAANSNLLAEEKIVFVKGRLDHRREKPNILATELIDIEDVREKLAAKVRIKLNAEEVTKEKVAQIASLCRNHRGKSPVYISIKTGKGKVYATAGKQLSINPNLDFCRKMRQLLGAENFQLTK